MQRLFIVSLFVAVAVPVVVGPAASARPRSSPAASPNSARQPGAGSTAGSTASGSDRCTADSQGPTLSCPSGLVQLSGSGCRAVPVAPPVTDDCDYSPTVKAMPAEIEGAGEHAVNFIATDRSGNVSACVVHYLLECDRCTPAAPGLVASWSMDLAGDDGVTVYDRAGDGSHGTAWNSPAPISGRVGNALHFDGGDEFVRAPTAGIHNYLSLTIDAWIAPDRVDEPMEIVAFQSGVYGLSVEGGELRFHLAAMPLWFVFRSEGANLQPGRWTHVAVTADRGTGEVTFYVDGERVSVSAPIYSPMLRFPGTEWLIGSGPGGSFAGAIDEVHIYERALSDEEVRAVVESGGAGLCEDADATAPFVRPLPPPEPTP